MKIRIPFDSVATIEQRKAAINEALQSKMPFALKLVLIDIPGNAPTPYTGGFTQMLLARAAIIEYEHKKS